MVDLTPHMHLTTFKSSSSSDPNATVGLGQFKWYDLTINTAPQYSVWRLKVLRPNVTPGPVQMWIYKNRDGGYSGYGGTKLDFKFIGEWVPRVIWEVPVIGPCPTIGKPALIQVFEVQRLYKAELDELRNQLLCLKS